MTIATEKMTELKMKYKNNKGFLIPLLQEIQAIEGYLSKETIQQISDVFDLKTAEIYGVATFYTMFRLQPVGKHIIKVCKGTACHVSGADNIISALKKHLSLQNDEETTADMQFTLMEVACLGCCSLAPAIMIDDKIYGNLTEETVKTII